MIKPDPSIQVCKTKNRIFGLLSSDPEYRYIALRISYFHCPDMNPEYSLRIGYLDCSGLTPQYR